MESKEELIENNKQNPANSSPIQRQIPSLKELAENAMLNKHGASLIGFIKEDEEAEAQAKLIEYPGKVSYPGIALFKQPLENKLTLVNAIVLAVVQGDLPKAEALIQQNPMLSSLKGEAIDYSGRTIHHVTPFQAALCAWDNEMCEMLAKYMDPEEVVRQYNEIFPEGIEAYRALQTPFDFSGVVNVISQYSKYPETIIQLILNRDIYINDLSLCKRVTQYRIDFTNCSNQEKIFNPSHLIQAYQLYIENFYRWNWSQRDLYWRQIYGYVFRFLPANIAQDIAQGIFFLIMQNEKAKRSLKYRSGGRGQIFPLEFDSQSGLGFDYAPRQEGDNRDSCGCDNSIYEMYKVYFENKIACLSRYAVKSEARRVSSMNN